MGLTVLTFAVFLVTSIALGPGNLTEEAGATHTTDMVTKTAYMTTKNCAADDGGGCQRTEDLNSSEYNAGAGGNDDPPIHANITIKQSSGLIQADGHGTGFVAKNGNVTAKAEILTGNRSGQEVNITLDASIGDNGGYYTLIYLNPNEKTCSRRQQDGSLDNDFTSMMIGPWNVSEDGTAEIHVNKTAPLGDTDDGSHDGLEDYQTASVRRVGHNTTAFANALLNSLDSNNTVPFDPAPAHFQLRACGDLVLKDTL